MIDSRIKPSGRLLQGLEDRAERLASARAEERLRERRADPSRWRRPRLLWPLIG